MIDVRCGQAEKLIADFADGTFDSIVTDPPYGLTDLNPAKVTAAITAWVGGDRWFIPSGGGFLGHQWDAFVPPPGMWAELRRVLKPGGHALVFASPRTLDLMGLSCRLAGFEVRDTITIVNGQAMPKSLDVAKAIAAQGLPDESQPWQGWGTALRVSNDPVLVLRNPLNGTVASNVLAFGVGGLNVDACRTASLTGTGRWPADVVFSHHSECTLEGVAEVKSNSHHPATRGVGGSTTAGHRGQRDLVERSPKTELVESGMCHPDCPVAELDRQSGVLKSGTNPSRQSAGQSIAMAGPQRAGERTVHRQADSGGASRFFPTFRYQPKATQAERPHVGGVQHPSVKPLELMRWLVRLVTPAGGTVLDPFAGSGSTAQACQLEGFNHVCFESNPDFIPLIAQRLSRAS